MRCHHKLETMTQRGHEAARQKGSGHTPRKLTPRGAPRWVTARAEPSYISYGPGA